MIKDRNLFTLTDKVLSYLKNYLGPIYMKCCTGNEGHHPSRRSTLTNVYYEKNVDPFAVSVSL